MKYLTKEWYELCQWTGLHFGMRVHKSAYVRDEALYLRLYKRKEKELVRQRRGIYDVDPRFMLEQDGVQLVALDKWSLDGDEISEEDTMVYHISSEERDRIQQLIAAYDARPPFDEVKCKEEFSEIQEWGYKEAFHKLPDELSSRIADMRVFALGYCTREVLRELKQLSKENKKRMMLVMDEYGQAQQAENIPEHIRSQFRFHDCRVTELTSGKQIVMRLDTQGGFTNSNKVTFDAVDEIIRQDEHILGSYWIYNELYRTDCGYEVHILFSGEGMPELIIRCADIVVEQE
ncbi:DUF4085 domain-containing protein [Paenibacillus chitinolyticus]|uniref:DUF4085 domain-containing protein n=1 Tax=Paenibacillus chitinolyticus TaxID=79263 RepID=A0A410WQ63_9BACL|nr:DUF4085 family protein [Paenibacillus chitinolyticus]MCY9591065.1 DUF4085 domain-containing protein [Paenibacillus chitinolyticus]MCY9597134.1 DUF4085 domain-containing protein [Paenibacillus chitinolyticus]QAV16493.1 DUF4085 domain-containing protein [Paenibacillus chitinolyticus]